MNAEINSMANAALGTSRGNEAPVRFFALDCVRASAMMLGVLYHALLFGGGMMMMMGGSPTFASRLMDWIHSFRMPLFFLISGFFSHMMLIKYGWGRYFLRRYWRIAVPLIIVLFALGGIRAWTGSGTFPGGGSGPGAGQPPGGFPTGRPGVGGSPAFPAMEGRGGQPTGGSQPGGFPGFLGSRPTGAGPAPGGGFGPGFPGGDSVAAVTGTKDPGLFTSEHWGMSAFTCDLPNGKYLAKLYFAETFAGITAPGQRVFSLNVQGHDIKDFDIWAKAGGFRRACVEAVPVEVTNGGFRIAFEAQTENPAINAIEIIPQADGVAGAASSMAAIRIKAGQLTPFTDSSGQVWLGDKGFEGGSMTQSAAGQGFGGFPAGGSALRTSGARPDFFGGGNSVSSKIFGRFSRNLNLQHLWFLCYLLVFATLAPAVTSILWWVSEKTRLSAPLHRSGVWSMRWGLVPLVLALVSVLGLIISGSAPGRPPSGYATIMGLFPDVFLRYDRDWAYFFIYFLGGWGLYTLRDRLDEVARIWLPTLAVGFGAYVASVALAGNVPGFFIPGTQTVTFSALAQHTLFAIAVTCTSFGVMGFFHRYFNRPTWAGRYLADTAFWIYIVHQDLLNMVVLPWVRPWALPQMVQALAAVAITTAIALVAFEIIIRPTPLRSLFGPPKRKKKTVAPVAVVMTETASS
jgi:hypothetical protein